MTVRQCQSLPEIDPSRNIHLHLSSFDDLRRAAIKGLLRLGFDQDRVLQELNAKSIKEGDYYAAILPGENVNSLIIGVVSSVRLHKSGGFEIQTNGVEFSVPISVSTHSL
jgi:hypothetical protein